MHMFFSDVNKKNPSWTLWECILEILAQRLLYDKNEWKVYHTAFNLNAITWASDWFWTLQLNQCKLNQQTIVWIVSVWQDERCHCLRFWGRCRGSPGVSDESSAIAWHSGNFVRVTLSRNWSVLLFRVYLCWI